MIEKIVYTLNQPPVKEGVKYAATTLTFAFGVLEAYHLYRTFANRKVEVISPPQGSPDWVEVAYKVAVVSAHVSLLLSAAVSRPGVYLISAITPSSVKELFGPNTIFAINPWHPRHVASITAVVLAIPPIILSAYQRDQLLFNTLTSRPVLHIGNLVGKYVF